MEEIPADDFRPCVAMALFNRAGLVLVAERIDIDVSAWQLPQGGIDDGESLRIGFGKLLVKFAVVTVNKHGQQAEETGRFLRSLGSRFGVVQDGRNPHVEIRIRTCRTPL